MGAAPVLGLYKPEKKKKKQRVSDKAESHDTGQLAFQPM
jgi:hypothetical protein